MAEELPNSISDLATNFSGIRVAHRTNLQQMEQLFNALSKKSAEYRDLWEKESAKNTASKTAIIALFEEVEKLKGTNTNLVQRLEYVEKRMIYSEKKCAEMRRRLRTILLESEDVHESQHM